MNISCTEPNDCDFEEDSFCGWENEKRFDQFEWEVTRGPSTPTYVTGKNSTEESDEWIAVICFLLGPLVDHTTGTWEGAYAFIDSSGNRKINDTAILVSQSMPDTSDSGMCIEFFYHM